MNKTILGFDVSSTTLAYSILECDVNKKTIPKLIDYGFIKPVKNGNIIERLASTRDKINAVIQKYQPDDICIEEIIQFMKGTSSAKTIITLAVFNRMIGLLSYDFIKRSPKLINVMSIRHCLKKQSNQTIIPKKEELPLLLEGLLNIKFPFIYKKNGIIKKESYDVSDAIACAYCYIVSDLYKK